ncbi:MAG: metalloregulator ArsR/SmtB family transcription factor [Eubacteriales bacterium]|nr:metalloregulator ArsR/SmtB family transcription factor [Eubacteriales bacterium]
MPKNEYICDCTAVHEDVVALVAERLSASPALEKATAFFKVLGDPTRMKILWALDQHELCVCDIANVLSMTKSAVSHQLAVLRGAALVTFRRDTKTVYYSLADDHVRLILEAGLDHVSE